MSRFSLFSTHYNKQVGSLYVFRAQSSPRTCIIHNVRRYASHTSCARTSPGVIKRSRKLMFSSMSTSRATQPFGTVSNAASQSSSAGTTINPFEQLGLHKGLVHGLGELGIVEPTNVQLKAIPAILKGKTVVCASETGSGKTLAFLLPVLQKLKVQELEAVANGEKIETLLNRPRAIVLVPTRELVVQTLQVLKRLSHQGKFRAEGLINTNARSKYPERPIDILVSTPSKLLEFRNNGKVFTSKVSVVIIDEADTIVSQGFDVETEELLGPLLDRRPSKKGRAAMDPAQLVFVGATILVQEVGYKGRGRDLIRSPITWLEEQGIDSQSIQVVRSDSVNHIPNQLVLETQHAGRSGKMTALLDTLRQIRQQKGRKSKTLIFCNDVAATRAVAHAIDDSMESNNTNPEEFSWDEDEFRTLSLHKMLPRKQRNEAVNAFTNPDTEHDIMVCTDLASRGLNFDESVETVINFDVPSSFTDFMHRIGRTARAGKPGRVVSIVTTRAEQQELEDRIRNARENSARIQSSPIRGSGGNFVSQYARLQQIDNKSKGTEQSSSVKGPKRSHGRDRLNRSRKVYFDSQLANRRSPGNKLPQSRSTGQAKHDTTANRRSSGNKLSQSRSTGQAKHDTTANRRSSGKKLPRSYSIGQTKHDTTERNARSWTNRSSHTDKWWK